MLGDIWCLDCRCCWFELDTKGWKQSHQEGDYGDTSVVRQVDKGRYIDSAVEVCQRSSRPDRPSAVTAHQLMIELALQFSFWKVYSFISSDQVAWIGYGWRFFCSKKPTTDNCCWVQIVKIVFTCCSHSTALLSFRNQCLSEIWNGLDLSCPQLKAPQDLGPGDSREKEEGGLT